MTSRDRHSTYSPYPEPPESVAPEDAGSRRSTGRLIRLALLLLLLAFVLWAGLKAWRVAGAARSLLAVEDEARALVADGPLNVDADAAEALLLGARGDIVTLRDELGFVRPIAPYLGWVPRFGPTLMAAPHLLEMADAGSEAAVLAVGALKPALPIVQGEAFGAERLGDLLPILTAAGPALEQAAAALERTAAARAELAAAVPAEALPWRVQQLLRQADELLPLGQSGLRLAPHLPALLGVDGPRRYLILAQNEDELRATGGFLTGAGVVTVENGRIAELSFMTPTSWMTTRTSPKTHHPSRWATSWLSICSSSATPTTGPTSPLRPARRWTCTPTAATWPLSMGPLPLTRSSCAC